jgi:hypothetical protein
MKNSPFMISLIAVSTLGIAISAFGEDCPFDRRIAALSAEYPLKPNWGTNQTYQYAYFLGSEGLKILKQYESCLNADEFAANYAALKSSRDTGREGCMKTSSTGGASCQPQYPE